MDERQAVQVLLVEDDPEDARLFRRHAESCEHYSVRVTHVTGAQEALSLLAAARPDLMFVDLRLGTIGSGLALLRQITAKARGLPVIVLTGTGNERTAVEAMKAGAADYLVKDAFSPEALEHAMRRALERLQAAAEREQAEQALRESEEKYRNVVEHASDGICVLQDGIIRYANSQMARMTGYCVDEVLGTSFLSYVHPDAAEELRQTHERFMSGVDDEARYQSALRHKDERRIEMEFSVSPTEYEGRRAALVFVRDVTDLKRVEQERRRLETQMQHAQKLESLGVLAGGIAHDFNNLLVGVLGNAGLALMELPPESPARQSIEQIQIAARRAAELCKQMLAYSGKGRFVIQPLNLSSLVREMGHLLQAVIPKKITLRYDFAEALPAVEGDPSELRQVVMNLITNAAEAIGDETGVITVRTGMLEADRQYLATTYLAEDVPAGTYVCLEVSDTGCGMDEQTKARIFDPFFTTKFTGRGLGLAAVLGIVRGHRGAIKIYSEPGRGTAFKVLLPCSQQPAVDLETKDEPISDWDGSGAILVADDEEVVRAVSRKTLEGQGFTVLTAANGPEALKLLGDHADEVVLVLLDLTMPRMSGLETFSKMRRVRRDVPIILSSGYNEDEAIGDFAGKDLAGFIQKPFDPKSLIRKVREVLRKQ